MSEYPADHPMVALRGRTIHGPAEVRRTIAERIAYLEYRLKMQKIEGRGPGRELPELKALVFVQKMLDDAYPVSDTDRPPAVEEIVP